MTAGVTTTLHNEDADRCVKIIKRSDGTFGFSEFRRDPEDAGGWTLVGDHPQAIPTEEQARCCRPRRSALAARHAAAGKGGRVDSRGGQVKPSRVVVSLHNDAVDRCVDIVAHRRRHLRLQGVSPRPRGSWRLDARQLQPTCRLRDPGAGHRRGQGQRRLAARSAASVQRKRHDPGNPDQGRGRRAGDTLHPRRQEERLHRPHVQRHVGGAGRGREERRHRRATSSSARAASSPPATTSTISCAAPRPPRRATARASRRPRSSSSSACPR